MATFRDYFSRHADVYARYRPQYPPELFAYLASLTPEHHRAWDCGTGNGQAAIGLAEHFDEVIATDPSEEQIANAFPHPKVTYRVARAEEPGIEPGSVDLVTVAQALHWFDIPRFFEEVHKVLKPGGVVAVWAYGLCRVSHEVDALVEDFYSMKVGPYWPKERALVDDEYRSVPFPFNEISAPEMFLEQDWTLDGLLGYLRSWSPVRRYIERHGRDPVDDIEPALVAAWGERQEVQLVRWPLSFRIGRR